MEWDPYKKLGSFFVMVIIAIAIFAFVWSTIVSELDKEGVVTDKYILPNVGGHPMYYLVLDNTTDVRTNEELYYQHMIGDYYNPN